MSKKNRERKFGTAESSGGNELTKFYWVIGAVAVVGIGIVGSSVGSKALSPTVSAPVVLEGVNDPSKLLEMAQPRVKGDPNAPIMIIEFADFQCPACGGFFSEVSPQIEAEFINTGKAKFLFYDFPLVQVHPNAFLASRAARCADDQGKFWPYHDVLYRTQGRWSSLQNPAGEFEDYAEQMGLDAGDFAACLRSDRYADVITASIELGTQLQLPGTPTVMVGSGMGRRRVASTIEGIREGVALFQNGG